jgi:hypothetical protein
MEDEKLRVGLKWTNDEELQLKREVEEKMSYEEIASIHKRNVNGIKIRVISSIIYNLYKKDENENNIIELSNIYKLEKDLIERTINKIDNKVDNKKKNNENNDDNNKKKNWKRLEDIENKLDLLLNHLKINY